MIIDSLINGLRTCCETFPDKRTGKNIRYGMGDIGMAAFSVFFTQSPSFLSYQRALKSNRGRSNCETLFGMERIPTDNHIRDMLDAVPPDHLFPLFDRALELLEERQGLRFFRRLDGHVLIALDGTEFFTSQKIGCPHCQTRKRGNGKIENYHAMLAAALVAPGHERAVPLAPEFITPQDGHDKQDCESRAVRRWLAAHGERYARLNPVYLGDDLLCRQPICEAIQEVGGHFILVAKPSSHKTLYEWLDGIALPCAEEKVKKGRGFVTHRYRWLNDVPLRDREGAMHVNWFEIEIVRKDGKVTYRNSFVTDIEVGADNVAELAACGRARWKIENEKFNTLKTKGYHLEHNFGHGRQHLAALLATMNLLAFSFHTVCDLADALWKEARDVIGTRKRFFEELRTITRYLVFPDWSTFIRTMVSGEPPPEPCRR